MQQEQMQEQQKKVHKQYYTRKNFIALALVCLYAVLLIFTAMCITGKMQLKGITVDGTEVFSEKTNVFGFAADNIFAVLTEAIFGAKIGAGTGSLICVGLVGIYLAAFTAAFIFEYRYALVNGKKATSGKMIAIYVATFAICAFLSVGVGFLTQPLLGGDNVAALATYLLQCIVVSLLIYVILFAVVGALVMLVVNFIKVDKPFDFFNNTPLEVEEEEEINIAESFDPVEPSELQKAMEGGGGGGYGGGGGGGASEGGSATVERDDKLAEREVVFPSISKIDDEYGGYSIERIEGDDVSLEELCEGFRNYLAKAEKLYFDINTIRIFISGLNSSRLLLLEGLSGTGKSSLPRYFAKYVNGRAHFMPVQATWRDRTNLLGYFNDFSKTYNETDFLLRLYEANYDSDRINMFVLDELNISRVEYYFADFLSVLEYPSSEWKLRIMHFPKEFLPPIKLDNGFIKIPENSYFIGTANKDDSTFAIADKVYDRAVTIDFDNRNEEFTVEGEVERITLSKHHLDELFADALNTPEYALTKEEMDKFFEITDFIYEEFDLALGNRILRQISVLVPTFVACGGSKEDALDFMLARKLIYKLEGRFEDYIKVRLKQLLTLLAKVYGAGTFRQTEKEINSLIRKL